MTTRILTFVFATVLATIPFISAAHAGELDNESKVVNEEAMRAKDLPGTVVVRVDEKGQASVLETSAALTQDEATKASLHSANFKPINSAGKAELDRASSTSSWFAWFNVGYYYAPTYYYYGYSYAYSNCYQYNYWGYRYTWYRW